MRRRLRDAKVSMVKHKAVGVDSIHVEMLQTAPALSARVLAVVWEKVGETKLIPEVWSTGILVPLHKKDSQCDPANYRPLCMLSHVRKVLEKEVIAKL